MRVLLISLVCLIAFASCKKNRNTAASASLIGKWTMIETSRIGTPWVPTPLAEQQSYEFKSDSTYIFKPPLISSLSQCNGTFKTSGEFLTINWDCGPGPAYQMTMLQLVNNDILVLDYITSATGYKEKYERR
ncbi:MAG: hypothetical protein WCF67_01520 [Chitinophagaceae bacterium]